MSSHIVRIQIPAGSSGPVLAIIEKIAAKAADTAGLLKNIGETELKATRERFDAKKGPDGSAWPANAPLTLMLARGGSMMKRTGGLVGSISYEVSGSTLKLGPNKVYAAAQQFGVTIKGKNGPLRIPVPGGTMMSKAQAAKLGVEQKKGRGKKSGDVAASKGAGAIYVQSVTIPPRPYIGIGAADAQAIVDTVEDWFSLK